MIPLVSWVPNSMSPKSCLYWRCFPFTEDWLCLVFCLLFKLVLLLWLPHLEDSQLACNGSLQFARFQLWMHAKGTQMYGNIWVIAKQFLFSKLSVYNGISNIPYSSKYLNFFLISQVLKLHIHIYSNGFTEWLWGEL